MSKAKHNKSYTLKTSNTWVFGYGSIIWHPDFSYLERKPAYIQGWARRFWQGSTDHRGQPNAPGRVVTLQSDPEQHCWGMAYLLASGTEEAVLQHLDFREKGGYQRLSLPIHFSAHSSVLGLTYLAHHTNDNYLGPAPLTEIAEQIVTSIGPSGPNHEYLLRLGKSLRDINAEDEHVFALEALVQARLSESPAPLT